MQVSRQPSAISAAIIWDFGAIDPEYTGMSARPAYHALEEACPVP